MRTTLFDPRYHAVRRPLPMALCSFKLLFMGTILFGAARGAYGQNLTIQQPAFSNQSVGTTVSVPDRGQAHLGSVSRAASSRTWNGGPFRSGSNSGLSREHSGSSVKAWIHDFEEMDRQLLNEGTLSDPSGRVNQYSNSSLARQNCALGIRAHDPLPSPSGDPRAEKAIEYYQRALLAERENKPLVARMFYRWAVQYGSQPAALKLARMEPQKSATAKNSQQPASRGTGNFTASPQPRPSRKPRLSRDAESPDSLSRPSVHPSSRDALPPG